MKIARYAWHDRTAWGIVMGDTIHALEGELWGRMTAGAPVCALAEARLLAPLEPTNKVIGCGLTFQGLWARYQAHHGPLRRDGPAIFMKQSGTHIGPGDPIVYPEACAQVIHEAEVAVVIGRTAKRVPAERALQYVAGYTCVNDVTGNVMKTSELPIVSTRFKNWDTFCPLGPVIETEAAPADLTIICRVNGREVVRGNTCDLVFSIAEQISWVSTVMALYPGDVICTGCPSTGVLHVGDVVEVEVGGIGVLQNPVVAEG